jgi:hypothetical protein
MAIDSNLARDGSHQAAGRIVDERLCGERAEWPSEGPPKGGMQMLALCPTPGQLDCPTALVFQQQGEQPTLRKGQR